MPQQSKGMYVFKQNYTKALEYWEQALELGDAKSYHDAGVAYFNGEGVEKDLAKESITWN